ncbi:MAG: DNA alkylation repair protein [Lentisphaeraceae bacterium]|nr:DNA alkylation repair protein [Lentisphaeraceae bacterium]
MKDVFNKENIEALAKSIKKTWAKFDDSSFLKTVFDGFSELSFSERNLRIAETLGLYLPENFCEASKILRSSLGEELPQSDLEGFSGFIYMPVAAFSASKGLDYFDESMVLQREVTKRFTSEFSIRYFLQKYPKKTMEQMLLWARDENYHVRRLASEGCRPRLPLSIRLHCFVKDPSPVLKVLEILKDDKQLYVRRSVANNLNDISKDHPDIVIETLERWQKENVDPWLTKHALRSLFKQGNKAALKLCGYAVDQEIACRHFQLNSKTVNLGESLSFSFELETEKEGLFMVDFVIHHMKANGKLSPKVFKLSKCSFAGKRKFSGKHSIREISTRKYYSGKYLIDIQVNGSKVASEEFELKI